jgi:hypothetical protein
MRRVTYPAIGALAALLAAAAPAPVSGTQAPTFTTVRAPRHLAGTVWDFEIDPPREAPQHPIVRGRLRVGQPQDRPSWLLTRKPLAVYFAASAIRVLDAAQPRSLLPAGRQVIEVNPFAAVPFGPARFGPAREWAIAFSPFINNAWFIGRMFPGRFEGRFYRDSYLDPGEGSPFRMRRVA